MMADIIWRDGRNREVAYQALTENTYTCPTHRGWNHLTYSAFHGHLAVVDALILDVEWDPDTKDINSMTALYAATIGNQVLAVKRLLHWGADPTLVAGKETWTPAVAAAFLGHTKILEILEKEQSRNNEALCS